MGLMQFLLPQREGLEQLALHGAYLVGSDGSPWETRVEWTGDRLVVSRNTRESGYLIMPWPIGTFGPLALSTATLLPRERPYHLALELCRGTLSRLLGQLDATALQDPHIREPLQASEAHFIQASLRQTDTQACAEEAEQSLLAALDCMQRRVRHVVTERNANASFSSRLFGLEAHGVEEFKQLRGLRRWPGNALLFYQTWRDTELSPGEFDWGPWIEGLKMALSSRRRIVAGPILDLHRDALPDWLYLWDGDFDTLQTYVAQYVRCIVQKLQRQIHVWYATASTNVGKVLHLGEEQKLRLTIAALEALRSVDRQTPTLVGIQQPWGEYLGRETLDLSPVQFADIVIRADLGVSGFVLELDMAVGAGYTIPRDLLEFQRLLDQWSGFNAPLVLRISLPTEANDQQATRLDYLRDILQIAASKSAVQGILWSRLRDDEHLSSGLFQPNGQPKSVLQMLTELDQHARQT